MGSRRGSGVMVGGEGMTELEPKPQAKKSDFGVRTASAIVMLALAGTALWLGGWVWIVFVAAVAFTCLAEFILLIFKAVEKTSVRAAAVIGATLYVGYAGLTLAYMRIPWADDNSRMTGLLSIVAVVGVVVCTDVGAYCAGRTIGGPKIAPTISPSKTWAGLMGGMFCAALWSVVMVLLILRVTAQVWGVDGFDRGLALLRIAAHGAVLAAIAQSGDFFESWLKRRAGVKDSSNLIPGHGGVFDRVDGLLPVLIVGGLFRFKPL